MTEFAMSRNNYTALKEYLHQLENDLVVCQSERDALFHELIFLLQDQPHAWRVWHLDNFHSKRLPESVMVQLREKLRIPLRSAHE